MSYYLARRGSTILVAVHEVYNRILFQHIRGKSNGDSSPKCNGCATHNTGYGSRVLFYKLSRLKHCIHFKILPKSNNTIETKINKGL